MHLYNAYIPVSFKYGDEMDSSIYGIIKTVHCPYKISNIIIIQSNLPFVELSKLSILIKCLIGGLIF